MSDTFLMGCGAGFSGDRVDAPQSVVAAIAASGKPGAIMFETLAERTLALGQLARLADPEKGYDPLLYAFLPPILPICLEHGIPIISNFGAANPPAAARLIRRQAESLGFSGVKIAVVSGDDVRGRIDLSLLDLWEGDAGAELRQDEVIAANAYLGARCISDALNAGAQIVVTGRVADPALALGPLVAHFGWDWHDWDRIAAGTLAGHLLECGAQVTGGYFADPGYKDVPQPENIGFPIAEVSADGGIVMTKAPGTGGLVSTRTVKEQILYEIHDPASYLTPDVILDVTGVEIKQVGPDRVRVTGAKGRAAPPSLKATVCFPGDWLGEGEITYAGPNALARARLAGDTVTKRIHMRGLDVDIRLDMIGTQSVFDSDAFDLQGSFAEPVSEVRLRVAVSGAKKELVEQSVQEVLALYCCGPAGGGGVRTRLQNRIRTASYMLPRNVVSPSFTFLDGKGS